MIKEILHHVKNFILQKGTIPYLEYNVVDHCNLNCAGCDHFCPIIRKEHFTDLAKFTEDIKELSKKLNIGTIRIMGGEPLLSPQINDFIKVTRKYYQYTDIRIATNGILLPSMEKSFWQTMRENNIKIDFTKYPAVGDKFAQYIDLCGENDVEIGHVHSGLKFCKFTNMNGDSNILETYKRCSGRNCANLWNSKLYQCYRCYVKISNEYFGMDIPIPEAMDIYRMSGKQMERICLKPSPACAYCNMTNPETTKWKQSAKKKSEWFSTREEQQ